MIVYNLDYGGGGSILKRADISTRGEQTPDLEGRYSAIANTIAQQTGFIIESELGKSKWWAGKTGVVIYKGQLPVEGHSTLAVLKIEAVKMEPDEITEPRMIHEAEKALAGSGIRPPKVYLEIPWTDKQDGYSAFVMEDVRGTPVLPVPGTEQDIVALLDVRQQYSNAFQANHVTPWVAPDFNEEADYVTTKFATWKQASKNNFPNHPFRQPQDEALIDQAVAILEKGYAGVSPEFQQGHFSHRDVVRVGDETVMFSNLYWSWRAPFYDMVFPSHWYMYEVSNVPGITIEEVEQQRDMWNRQYDKIVDTLSPEDKKLFNLAQIERLAAGLNIDVLSISTDPQNSMARHMVEKTREDLKTALDKI